SAPCSLRSLDKEEPGSKEIRGMTGQRNRRVRLLRCDADDSGEHPECLAGRRYVLAAQVVQGTGGSRDPGRELPRFILSFRVSFEMPDDGHVPVAEKEPPRSVYVIEAGEQSVVGLFGEPSLLVGRSEGRQNLAVYEPERTVWRTLDIPAVLSKVVSQHLCRCDRSRREVGTQALPIAFDVIQEVILAGTQVAKLQLDHGLELTVAVD